MGQAFQQHHHGCQQGLDALGHRSDRPPSGLRQTISLRFEHLFVNPAGESVELDPAPRPPCSCRRWWPVDRRCCRPAVRHGSADGSGRTGLGGAFTGILCGGGREAQWSGRGDPGDRPHRAQSGGVRPASRTDGGSDVPSFLRNTRHGDAPFTRAARPGQRGDLRCGGIAAHQRPCGGGCRHPQRGALRRPPGVRPGGRQGHAHRSGGRAS